jgi:AAA domain, putative AbiEii toxin, Type IV TA system
MVGNEQKTMTLKFQSDYESIKEFKEVKIPNFTVITGLNGTGKTHLLEAIQQRKVVVIDAMSTSLRAILHTWQTLNPANIGAVSRTPFLIFTRETIQEIKDIVNRVKTQSESIEKNGDMFVPSDHPHQLFPGTLQELGVAALQKKLRKPIWGFTDEEIDENAPSVLDSQDPFLLNLYQIFLPYQQQLHMNSARRINDSTALSDADFMKNNSPPWETLNTLLREHGFPYTVRCDVTDIGSIIDGYISGNGGEYLHSFKPPILVNNKGTPIPPNKLSSGEKLLISFLLSLFSAKNWNINQGFPDLLLLDEVDAFLHPALSQKMLDILNDIIVKELGVKVILVTHSATTVALAPEGSIFIMNKEGPNRLVKAETKDHALATLTVGVPTLSIEYNNRRQVFVEGPDDFDIYTKVFDVLKATGKLEPAISLTFIPADVRAGGKGAGGCKVVIDTLKALKGNKSIFGIIDWDGKNEPAGNLLVIGQNDRCNHENYLFEPLPMFYYALSMKLLKPEQLGLNNKLTYADVKELDETTIQGCVDKMVEFFEQKGGLESLQKDQKVILNRDKTQCKAVNNLAYKVPKYFLEIDGKKFRPAWKAVLDIADNSIPHDNLQDSVIKMVFEDEHFSTLLSKDFLDLFLRIQKKGVTESDNPDSSSLG